MKRPVLLTVAAFFLLVGFCAAQRPPATALGGTLGNDVSLSYALLVKNTNFDLGNGADLTATHYLSQHIGLSAQAETARISSLDLREYAVRFGPTLRACRGRDLQPFARFLLGYSRTSANYTGINRPYVNSASFLAGGGVDVRLKNAFFTRVTLDVIDNWDAKTRYGRGTVGFAYHFGESAQ